MFAPSAEIAVVTADTDDGAALFAVDLAEQQRPGREPAMDMTRELGWLRFDDTPAVRLGAADAVDALLDRGATFAAVGMLGGASRAMGIAVAYAKGRGQF